MRRDARRRGRSPRWRAVHRAGRRRAAPGRASRGRGRAAPTWRCAAASTCPPYLGSRATFTAGRLRRPRRPGAAAGDVLRVGDSRRRGSAPHDQPPCAPLPEYPPDAGRSASCTARTARPTSSPTRTSTTFFATDVAGPPQLRPHRRAPDRPQADLGPRRRRRGGLHPSNIHDNAYAVGTVDFTGDMPIILGPDGPSLGGFVCPATIVAGRAAGRWASSRPATGSASVRVTRRRGGRRCWREQQALRRRRWRPRARPAGAAPLPLDAGLAHPGARARRRRRSPVGRTGATGDDYLLVEYGPPDAGPGAALPRAHALMEALAARRAAGHHRPDAGHPLAADPLRPAAPRRRERLLRPLQAARGRAARAPTSLRSPQPHRAPAAVLGRPGHAGWRSRSTCGSVRADAPWCPSNIEFIRRINGLASVDEVRRIVFDASYLVLGLGDVYLGAPVATPIDPRHRLVTTKYNPARTWTPGERGGHRRRLPVHLRHGGPGRLPVRRAHGADLEHATGSRRRFRDGQALAAALLRSDPLLPGGGGGAAGACGPGSCTAARPIRIEEGTFDFPDYQRLLAEQRAATSPPSRASSRRPSSPSASAGRRPARTWRRPIRSRPTRRRRAAALAARLRCPCSARWRATSGRSSRRPGDRVAEGEPLAIVEAMKTEISVTATSAGTVRGDPRHRRAGPVQPGQILAVLQESLTSTKDG